jgi:ribonucleotide reductase alpha subunit
MFNLKWTPPGRGLWVTGTPLIHERGIVAGLYNCFTGDTKAITKNGVVRLDEIVGEEHEVWADGEWHKGVVSEFGESQVNRIQFKPFFDRSNHVITIDATPDHRWILDDGTETINLSVGDKVVASGTDVNVDSDEYYVGVVHGIVFGDGTRHAFVRSDGAKRFHVRLCGDRADEMKQYFGHITYPQSANGDAQAYVLSQKELKEFPVGESPEYVSGFIHGWLLADGNGLDADGGKLDTQHVDAYSWLSDYAAYGGYVVVGHNHHQKPTNYGERKSPLHRITLRKSKVFKVVSITELDVQPTYCFTVPSVGKFTLASGLVTGNCSFISTGDMDHRDPGAVFAWVMDALMLGVGVGFDTRGEAKDIRIGQREGSDTIYEIPDSREGWAESVRLLLNSFLRTNKEIDFDYSLIRPYGEPIKGFGGTASGPGPLKKLHKQITHILENRAGEVFDARAIVDMVNLIGTCVVAGNVRRSATIALGKQGDNYFIELKNYEKYPERAEWGWMSNNTVVIDEPGYDYADAAHRIADNGEPGFLFLNTMQQYGRLKDAPDHKDWRVLGTNPCAEISLESRELCNLVEIHLNRHESMDDYLRTIKFAYLYAKSITLLPTHWPETNAVIQRNRRIGASMTGIAGFVDKHGLPEFREWADNGYNEIQMYDKKYSEWLGIRESIRTTTVKPSGSVSLLSGATPGVHWPSGGKHYLRAIRFSNSDPMLTLFKMAWYKVEPDVTSDNTSVVYFPVKTDMERSEKDVSIYEKIHLAAEAQSYWSDNSVSVTVTFDPETERDDIARVLKMYEGNLKTVSFLPMSNKTYPQMPYTEITEAEYHEYVGMLLKIDFDAVYQGVDNLEAVGSKYCDGDTCTI